MKIDTGKEFRTRDLYYLELSKQLISYHLRQLESERVLDSEGRTFWIIDRDKLVDSFIEAGQPKVEGKMFGDETLTLFRESAVEGLNTQIELTALGRILQLPDYRLIDQRINHNLDKINQWVKEARIYTKRAEMSKQKAKTLLEKYDPEELESIARDVGIESPKKWAIIVTNLTVGDD